MSSTIDRFMAQQGFRGDEPSRRRSHFLALQLQPSVLGLLVVVGIIFQSASLFFVLAAVLVWNVVMPRLNPFERLYDWVIGGPASMPQLEPAPAPRRFAQGMAATFMAITGLSLALGWMIVAYVFEAFLLVALIALVAGRFCMGSYIFHTLRGRGAFANSTSPWSK
ncbi:MAG: DUF4395 domain-containing protein [Acidobacteria bacterium]|nr:MAG: DUF4395 domain-containing protein [Acidobacteriota bacterium]